MDTHKAKRVLRSIHKVSHRRFVLHGALTRSNTLLPNKPSLQNFKNKRKAKGIRRKAVYATRLTHVAVIYATLPNETMWKLKAMWRPHEKKRYLRILYQEPRIILRSGYIHVCRADSFSRGALITTSRRSVKVVRTFKITPDIFLYLWDRKDLQLFDRP